VRERHHPVRPGDRGADACDLRVGRFVGGLVGKQVLNTADRKGQTVAVRNLRLDGGRKTEHEFGGVDESPVDGINIGSRGHDQIDQAAKVGLGHAD